MSKLGLFDSTIYKYSHHLLLSFLNFILVKIKDNSTTWEYTQTQNV